VSQHKVVTAIRACEVAADPTNALALEAAVRRAGGAAEVVRLAAIQRVVRAQRFPVGWAAHFGLFAMVTAGRDRGSHRFARAAIGEHLRFGVAALRAAGVPRVQVALTPLSEAGERIAAELAGDGGRLAASAGNAPDADVEANADVVLDGDRASGRGYYRDLCFKVNALTDGGTEEIGDGGFTDWTARLLANGKERLLISGYGTDRLASVTDFALSNSWERSTGMYASILNITFDCADARAQARFWAAVTGGTMEEQNAEPGHVECSVALPGGAGPRLYFTTGPEPKAAKNRIHLDVIPPEDDAQAELARLLGLGATVTGSQPPGASWLILADPEGNEFCLEGAGPAT
jgi:hypothetical protein